MIPQIQASATALPVAEDRVSDLAAEHGFVPDDFTAYLELKMSHAMPALVGPTMSGDTFAFHPQVLANSYQTLLHKPANLHHAMKAAGARRDRLVGTVIASSFPQEPSGGWAISDSPDLAPGITAVAAIHKLAEGVDRVLGEHLSGKRNWSVSMESTQAAGDLGIFHPGTGELLTLAEARKRPTWNKQIGKHENGFLKLGQLAGAQLAFAPGHDSGTIAFQGFALTPTPAEETAGISSIAASAVAGDMIGVDVTWAATGGDDPGRGTVEACATEGPVINRWATLQASKEDPVLTVRPEGKNYSVLRLASSLEI